MRVINTKSKIMVGGFVMLASTAAILGVILAGDGLESLKERRTYRISFPDASGLQDSTPVKMGGLNIGRVTDLNLAYVDGHPAAVAKIEVLEPYFAMVHVDTRVRLETQGVLGDRYVALVGGSPNSPLAENGAAIGSEAQLTFNQITQHTHDILTSVETILSDVRRFTHELPDGNQVRLSVDSLTKTAENLQLASAALIKPGSMLQVASSAENGAKLNQSLSNIEKTSSALAGISQKIESGDGTLGLMINDPGLYDDAQTLLGRTNRSKMARNLVREAIRSTDQTIGH